MSQLDPSSWSGLFSLGRRGAEDLRVLEQQLRAWCHKSSVPAAALYVAKDDVWRLRVRCGDGELPKCLPHGDEAALSSLRAEANEWISTDELPEALLLYRSPKVLPGLASDADLLLLAAGARISGLKHQIHQQSFQVNFRGVELEALYDVGLAIASTLDEEELSEEILLRAIALLDARRGALYLLEEETYRLQRSIGGAALEKIAASKVDLEEEPLGGARLDDTRSDEAQLEGEAGAVLPSNWMPGCRYVLAVPIAIDRVPRGLLVVADKESRRGIGPFLPADRRTLMLFANQAAIALENAKLHKLALDKERLEREMELAAEIQQQILPKAMPEIPGFEALGWNRPARQIGGDYFDVRSLDHEHWGLVVGDVTGKGMPAALLVSTLHSALRLLLDRMDVGPELIERLNRHIYESSSSNKFITMLLATLDNCTNELVYLNAGHNPGLVVRRDGQVEELGSGGVPLGLLPQTAYGTARLILEPGDLVCIYSDGITECQAPDEEELGLERLVELLRQHRESPLGEIMQAIDCVATEFAQGQPQGDDQTIVLLRRTESV